MKSIFVLIVSLFCITGIYAQTEVTEQASSAVEELKMVIDDSNNFEQYKVVNRNNVYAAIDNVFIEMDSLNAEIKKLKDSIDSQEETIGQLQSELSNSEEQLAEVQNQKDEILFLGLSFTKSSYQLLVWSIIILLVLLVLFLIFQYKRSHLLTKEAKQSLKNLDADYENYKRVALEKQQKLGRQLQDEKNKVQKLSKTGKK